MTFDEIHSDDVVMTTITIYNVTDLWECKNMTAEFKIIQESVD